MVELQVEWSVEVPELLECLWRYEGMRTTLGLPQAAGPPTPLRLLQTGEALGLVEVKVLVPDNALEAQEVLDTGHLPCRVGHQPLTADKQEM